MKRAADRKTAMIGGILVGIHLRTVAPDESEKLCDMQQLAFRALLDKYHDYNTNPGVESLMVIEQRLGFDDIDHYWIQFDTIDIGYIRITRQESGVCRLSRMFILPEFQGKGYAQQALKQAESRYPQTQRWELDTIKQEIKLCHLYEKMGYRRTGDEHSIQEGMDLVDYVKP